MFKAFKKSITSICNVVSTTADVLNITMDSTKDLAKAMKHTTAAYEIEVELLKQKRIDILQQYKDGSINHDDAMESIKELNAFITALNEANESDEV